MAKYLIEASYTLEGVQGLLKEGGSGRRAAVERLIASAGGTIEALYFVFGDDDIVIIADLPDNASAAALSLAVSASGSATSTVRVLLTPEEIDTATKKSIDYRAPGR
jgi:uncharacterized protein with GYD domain